MSFFIVVGCNKANDPKKQLLNSLKDVKTYHLQADMTVLNDQDNYEYFLDVSYKDDDFFRVSMKNKTNNHEQIILRNAEGVFVLTPSLNKSFKFQSEWPYNDSQAYLLQTIIKDIKEDKDSVTIETDEGNIVKSKVKYSNNPKLVNQNVYLDNDNKITKVEVTDANDKVWVTVEIISCELNPALAEDLFDVNNNMSVSKTFDENIAKEISPVIYPMYIPANTYLTSQDKISKTDGERIILNFAGERNFTIIEETATISENSAAIPVSGTLYQIADVVGIKEENSISWISNGIEYYVVSEDLTNEELLDVAKSMSTLPVSK